MRCGLLTWLLLHGAACLGQPSTKADSLAAVVESASSDTARARALNALGRAVFATTPKDAITHFDAALGAIADARMPNDSALHRLHGEVLNNLGAAHERIGEYSAALRRYREAIDLRTRIGDRMGLANSFANLAVLYRKQGETKGALEANLRALNHARAIADPDLEQNALINLALLYQYLELPAEAHRHYASADSLARARDDRRALARILNGQGGLYTQAGQADSALHLYRRSLALRKALHDEAGMATVFANLAEVLEAQGDPVAALAYLDSCIAIRAPRGDRSGLVHAQSRRAGILLRAGRAAEALRHARAAQAFAAQTGSLNDQLMATKALSEALAGTGDHRGALEQLRAHQAFKDSLNSSERAQELLREDFRLSIERLRVSDSLALESERQLADVRVQAMHARSRWQWTAVAVSGASALLLLLLYRAVRKGKRRSDELLLNILPAQVADELKRDGRAQAVRFDQATVIFADIVGFTALSERLGPEQLVRVVDACFSAFDRVVLEHGAEKIKTVGDAYMAVCGVPRPSDDHALKAARTALGMLAAVERLDLEGLRLQVRIGLHSGPVVAGIVGLNKFQYDIWGDTVNTAARMQAASEPGRINVSGATRAALGQRGRFEARGNLDVKGKGAVEMHFLLGLA
jgi:class 3 adenylate cyclase